MIIFAAVEAIEDIPEVADAVSTAVSTYDFEQLMPYLDTINMLLVCIVFALCIIVGLLIGHYIIYRFRG